MTNHSTSAIFSQSLGEPTAPLHEPPKSSIQEIISLGFPAGRDRLFELLLEVCQRSESEAVALFEEFVGRCELSKKAGKALERDWEKFLKSKVVKPESPQELALPKGWHVLGYTSTHDVLLWERGKSHRLSANELRASNPAMSLLFGPKAPHDELGAAIISRAHEKGLIDTQEILRRGVWKLKDGWGVISGKEVLRYGEDGWCKVDIPVLGERLIALEKDPWIDLELLLNPPYTLEESLKLLIELVSLWNWSSDGDGPTAPQLMAAYLSLAPFQQSLSWRPWIYVTGARNTGKSTFFDELIAELWGSLVAKLGKTTPHAFAQTVSNSGAIPVMDEFEKLKNQDQILELLKLCSSGGFKTSGTPGASANEFSLKHMPWLGSIYLPKSFASDAAQMSRTVVFRLEKHAERPLSLPSSHEMKKIAASLIAGVMKAWPDIESAVAEVYATKHRQKADGRMVDNLSYALAILKITNLCELQVPSWLDDVEVKDDGEAILESILSAKIRGSLTCTHHLIGDLIQCALRKGLVTGGEFSENTAKAELRLNGISVVEPKVGGWLLAIRPGEMKAILDDTPFKDLEITEPLQRLPKVEVNKATAWGGDRQTRKCMHIPGALIDRIYGVSDPE